MPLSYRLSTREKTFLFVLLLVAFLLRFYRLGFESFWMDELFVAIEADPHLPLSKLFDALKCCDQHPPLFYLLQRGLFYFFGCTETTARILPAIAGVASVYALFLLGREISGNRLGFIAATLTCVNHFNIYYSREARDYIFVFLFGALSLVYLFRLIKSLKRRDMWLYTLFALLTVYSHYFGLLLVFSEFCAASIFFAFDKHKKLFAQRFMGSALLIAAGFAVWVPVLLSISRITSFWIPPPTRDWLTTFFGNYYDSPDLAYSAAALILVYFVAVFAPRSWKWPATTTSSSSLTLSFIVLWTSTVLCYAIPYIRSRLVVPMLLDRYTIIVLPAILVSAAYGIELIPWRRAGSAFLLLLALLSIEREIRSFRMYSAHHKTQFRETTAYICSDTAAVTGRFPVLNDRIGWFESYYLRKMNYPGQLIQLPRAAAIDSFIAGRSIQYNVKGFWLMNAHQAGSPEIYLDPRTQKKLDSCFIRKKEGLFNDAWVVLYLRRRRP